jgi:hypothetical protein
MAFFFLLFFSLFVTFCIVYKFFGSSFLGVGFFSFFIAFYFYFFSTFFVTFLPLERQKGAQVFY